MTRPCPWCESLSPELIVVAAYGKILPEELLDYPKYGSINVHSSLLPKYRGAAPINWAILNGETETGVSIMYMAKDLDAGDVIRQTVTPIGDDEDAQAADGPPGGPGSGGPFSGGPRSWQAGKVSRTPQDRQCPDLCTPCSARSSLPLIGTAVPTPSTVRSGA